MPVQIPQDTPGTNSISIECTTQPPVANTKKRAGTEMGDEARDAKKVKVETTTTENDKDKDKDKKKKKKKKKTRRTSVVLQIAQASVQREPLIARSSTVPPAPAPPSPSKRATTEPKHSQTKTDSEGEQVSSSSDKGKGRAQLPRHAQRATATPVPPQQPVASGSGSSNKTADQASEIADLKAQLASQRSLLERHQHHFVQHQQSLTCQICLDLMHKPYALAPCGHMTCYGCLVRWFTAPTNPEAGQPVVEEAEGDGIDGILNSAAATTGTFLRRRKNCPVCRASVTDRPIEMWGIKGMVASLVKSGLAELPLPAPTNVDVPANTDPWRNIFRKAGAPNHRHPFEMAMHGYFMPPAPPPPPAGEENREAMGWYDGEDGGIYRCIDCYHEIFYGRCSRCGRPYPGHRGGDDDDDDFDDDDDDPGLPENLRRYMRGLIGDEDDLDDESIDEEAVRQNRLFWEHHMDGEELDGEEGEEDDIYGEPFDPAEFGSDGEDDDDEDIPPRLFGDRRPQHHHQLAQMLFGHAGPTPRRTARTDQVVEDEEEEEEDSDYEGSFINDDPDSAAGDTELDDDDNALDHQVPNPSRERRRRVELSSDVEEPRLLARLLGRASRQAPTESDDDDEVEVVSGPAPIPRHQQRSRVLSSDEGSGYESPPRRLRRNVTVTSVLDSEEEDSLEHADEDEDDLHGDEVDSDVETGSILSRRQYTYPLSDGEADQHHYGEDEDDEDDGW